VRLAPPLCITAQETDQLVAIVADSIAEVQRNRAR
jgi:4-aminobutyrate aminotransferase-like enzyme